MSAKYTLQDTLSTTVPAGKAWASVTDAIKAGATSVEIVERSVAGEDVYEIRAWVGRRHDGSNKKSFPPDTDPHCPNCDQ